MTSLVRVHFCTICAVVQHACLAPIYEHLLPSAQGKGERPGNTDMLRKVK